jgi:MFS superfamily sulfate permease-like transporter
VANVASGLFQGFSVSASASRTPAAEAAGARTQMTGLFGAATIAVILVAVPGLFRNLPTAALAAVVIAAASSLVEIRPLVSLAKARPSELVLSLIAFAAIAFAGAIRGVLIAIAVSLIAFIVKAWRPHTATLVRVDGLKGYHDGERHPEGRTIPGLVLYRFDAPLFFANAELFRQQVLHHTRPEADVCWLVVTAEPITDIDATGAAMLETLHDELRARDVAIAFAELKGHVRERLDRFGLVERFGRDRFYRTVGEAVHAYLAEEDVPWTDWEDRHGTG